MVFKEKDNMYKFTDALLIGEAMIDEEYDLVKAIDAVDVGYFTE